MSINTVILVGADKGGVGKTTVARTLLEYFNTRDLPARAFDTESPKGNLRRFYPDVVEIADVTAVPDQMRILDSLQTVNKLTVIDVRAGQLSWTMDFFDKVGFFDALKRAEVRLAVFHVLGPSVASLSEIEDIAPYVSDANYFLVKNFINDTSFFEWDRDTYNRYFNKVRGAVEITVPKLSEMAYEQVDLASSPFLSFIANKGREGNSAAYSFVLRGYVRHWLSHVWAEYERIKLADIVRLGFVKSREMAL